MTPSSHKNKSDKKKSRTSGSDTSIKELPTRSAKRTKPGRNRVIYSSSSEHAKTSAGESDSSSHSRKHKKSRKAKSYSSSSGSSDEGKDSKSNYDVLKDVLPGEARLMKHQKTKINQMTMSEVLDLVKLKRAAEQANIGESATRFSKDKPPKVKNFKEEPDDGVKILHKARFLRCPLSDLNKWWKLVPAVRSHMYKTIPLRFSGSQSKISDKTISSMHDRAKALSIKNFHSQNATVAAKPMKKIERKDSEGLITLYDYSWEEPTSLSEFTEALINYLAVMQQLWPLDPTGIIMLRLINSYKWISAATELREKVSVLSSYFNGALQENANRAIRGETIMDYKEHEDVLKTALTAHNLPSAGPSGRIPRLTEDQIARNRGKFNQYLGTQLRVNPAGFQKDRQNQRPRAFFNKLGVCYSYNNGTCKSPSSQNGCKNSSSGRELAHVCNVYIEQKNAFCLGKHPRTAHKF